MSALAETVAVPIAVLMVFCAWGPVIAATGGDASSLARGAVAERPLTDFQYKASHNSYERGTPLNEQIDDLNCWMLELDLTYDGGQVFVCHECDGVACYFSARPLEDYLQEVAAATTTAWKVTWIYMEMKPCAWPDPAVYEDEIRAAVTSILGSSRIYVADEFKTPVPAGDAGQWPSWQELVRRGRNFIVVLDRSPGGEPSDPDDPFFFDATSDWPVGVPNEPTSMIMVLDEDGDRPIGPVGNYWVYRSWPNWVQIKDCWDLFGFWGQYWRGAINNGYHFVPIDCVEEPYTMGLLERDLPRVHPPQPFFMRSGGGSENSYGTRLYPYGVPTGGLEAGLDLLEEGQDVILETGEYRLNGRFLLNRKVTLYSGGGSVVIR